MIRRGARGTYRLRIVVIVLVTRAHRLSKIDIYGT